VLRVRVIPTLLLRNQSLVKTVRFGRYSYVGDPCNTVRIFNEIEVDELIFLDITATPEGRSPNLRVLSEIADECFMPLGYGGGIRSLDDAKAVFDLGYEKVVINSEAVRNPRLISQIANVYGSQAVIVSIDAKRRLRSGYKVVTQSAKVSAGMTPWGWAKRAEELGAGEILLTAVHKEGTWSGFDLSLVRRVSDAVDIPLVAQGGAGSVADLASAVKEGGASAVAVGSMVVFQKKGMGVLVNFPERDVLEAALGS
jgi:imidazole glycerol-phosphate synthase subunit HisF